MKNRYKKRIKKITQYRRKQFKNVEGFNAKKLAEECAELNLILLQNMTQPHNVSLNDIIEELGDVKITIHCYIEDLKRKYGEEVIDRLIEKRVDYKTNRLLKKFKRLKNGKR